MKRLVNVFAAVLVAALVLVQGHGIQAGPHRIDVTAKEFEFLPGEITLKKSELVVLVLKSVDVAHGIRFKELGIETKVGKGQTSELPIWLPLGEAFIGVSQRSI